MAVCGRVVVLGRGGLVSPVSGGCGALVVVSVSWWSVVAVLAGLVSVTRGRGGKFESPRGVWGHEFLSANLVSSCIFLKFGVGSRVFILRVARINSPAPRGRPRLRAPGWCSVCLGFFVSSGRVIVLLWLFRASFRVVMVCFFRGFVPCRGRGGLFSVFVVACRCCLSCFERVVCEVVGAGAGTISGLRNEGVCFGEGV